MDRRVVASFYRCMPRLMGQSTRAETYVSRLVMHRRAIPDPHQGPWGLRGFNLRCLSLLVCIKTYATDIVCDRLTFERTCGFGVVAFRSSEWQRSGANGRDGDELLAPYSAADVAAMRLQDLSQ